MKNLLCCLSILLAFVAVASPLIAQRVYQGNQKGLPPFGTFSGSDFDLVSMSNRNLHAEIPIVSIPQRGRVFSWRYVFDTYSWKVVWFPPSGPYTEGYWVVQRVLNEGGWRLVNPFAWTATYIVKQDTCPHEPFHQYSTKQNWMVRAPDGTKHPTPVTHETGPYTCFQSRLSGSAQDGSGINLTLTTSPSLTYTITLNDGTRVTTYRDANGNLASASADMLNRAPVVVSDASYITYTTPLNKSVSGPAYTTWTVRDSNGSTQSYRVDYTAIDIQTALCQYVLSFSPCFEYSSGWLVPRKLTLPTGQVYEFFWTNNSLGQLTKINLPTGGYIEYTYDVRTDELPEAPHHEGGNLDAIAGVTSRKLNGVAPGWTYAGLDWVTATDPDLNQTVHENNYVTVGGTESGSTVETKVRVYAGAATSGTLLRTIVKDYTGEVDPISERLTNLRVLRETTVLENNLQSKVETDYETFTYPPYSNIGMRLNVLERREYAYGTGAPGALVRKTVNTYLHTGNQPYLDRNIVNRAATSKIYDGGAVLKAQTTFEYDNYTEGIQSTTAVQHDSAFGSTFATRGNLTAVKRWRNTDSAWLETRHQYDDVGNIIKTKDPGTHTTLFDYADNWAVTACAPAGQGRAYVKTVTNALGHTASTKYDSCTGLVREVTDPNARVTALTYDLMNRPDQTNLPLGEAVDLDLDYDDAARIVTSKTLRDTGTFIYQKTRFDSLGRVWRAELCEDGSASCTTSVKTDTKYDDFGRTWKVWNPTRLCDPQVDENNCASESTFGKSQTAYDALGRVDFVTTQDNTVVDTAYSGNTVTVTDQAGKKRKSETDALGRLTRVWEPDAAGNWAYETAYQYDVLDNLTRVDQKGGSANSADWRTRTFTYNSLSQLLSATNPESGTITYAYDNDGNLLTKTAPKPNQTGSLTVTTTYTYDALHRLIEKSYNDGATATVKYGYDNVAPSGCTPPTLTITNPIGRRTSMCDAGGASAWTYDDRGRVVRERRKMNDVTNTKDVFYEYKHDNSIWRMTYQNGKLITYSYDPAGRPLSLLEGTTNWLTEMVYHPHGAPNTYKLGVGLGGFAGYNNTFTYNKRLQPINIIAGIIGGATILSRTYDFHLGADNNGNVYKITNNLDGGTRPVGTVDYTYDQLNRIASAATTGTDCTVTPSGLTKNWGNSYEIDPWGNLTKKNVTKCSAEYLNEQANGKNQFVGTNRYDAAGNLWENGTYTYDAENRLITAGGVTYTYDGDGRRVKKSNGTLYWYDVSGNVLVETQADPAGSWNEAHVYFGGKRILRHKVSGAVRYIFADHLGSASLVGNFNGTVMEEIDFYPYGGTRVISSAESNAYKFTGKERDTETGLDYFGARYHTAEAARFMTPDWTSGPSSIPYADLSYPQSLNLYTYVGNNPLAYRDPDGHCWPLSACADKFIAAVNEVADRVETTAVLTGDPNIAAQVTFATGVGRDLLTGFADAFKAGDAIGACIDNCTAVQTADAISEDLLRTSSLVSSAAGAGGTARAALTTRVTNPIPRTLARAVRGEAPLQTLGKSGDVDVFVTAADDIAGMNASQMSTRLGIPSADSFTVIEFRTPGAGLASPINRTTPGFVGRGQTTGGAREFVVPNGPIPANATIRVVR